VSLSLLKKHEPTKAPTPSEFQALVRPYLDSLRRFALSFAKNAVEADDLAQEALIKAFRFFHTFDGRSSLSTWLYTVARSVYLDSLRSRRSREQSHEVELDDGRRDSSPNQELLMERCESSAQLWVAIRRLEEPFRIALVLADIEELDYDTIAAIEGVAVGTVKSRVSRARSRLYTMLSPEKTSAESEASGTPMAPISSNPKTGGNS
jgi:RNA polymerase sigma-70 factor, ECF subfamily